MTGFLTDEERARLLPSELLPHPTPIPTQVVSSDEFYPDPQNSSQREVEARLLSIADELGGRQGLDRRRFFQTAAGMAASFMAMNEIYGPLFAAEKSEAAEPELARERAESLKGQFIMDMHSHFLRDDTRLEGFVSMRTAVGKAGWNKALAEREQTLEDLKYGNYVKEMFLDSDTKMALISSAPSDIPQDWFLTNEQMAAAREKVNREAGARRLLSHMIFTPGKPGWLDELDAGLALKPDSVKGLRRRRRRRTGGEGLAPAQLHHLSRRLPARRWRSEGGSRGVPAHGPHRLDERSRRRPRGVWSQ
jgi:hypothetical protein